MSNHAIMPRRVLPSMLPSLGESDEATATSEGGLPTDGAARHTMYKIKFDDGDEHLFALPVERKASDVDNPKWGEWSLKVAN